MGRAEETSAAVRIELADDEGMAPAPGDKPLRGGSGRVGSLSLVVLAAFGLVAILVATTRPSDGRTAAGTPITSPSTTSAPGESTGATSTEVDSFEEGNVIAPSTSTSPDAQVDPVETSEVDILIFNVVDADFGWIALGFGLEDNAGALWRSTDGLEWSALPAGSLPEGDVLGFDRFDGTYLLAVDELGTWSNPDAFDFGLGTYPEHRISVWTSSDAVSWVPSDLPIVEGTGFPYPVSLGTTSYAVPLIDEPEGPNDLLVELLSPFLDAGDAARVCSSRRQTVGASASVMLEDCEGQVVAEVRGEDHPETFDRLGQGFCIQAALSAGQRRFSTMFAERGGEATRAEFSSDVDLFGRATSKGVLTFTLAGGMAALPPECGGEATAARTLSYWTADTGSADVSPTISEDSQLLINPFGVMGRAADGRIAVVLDGGVWSSEPPFERWDEVVEPVERPVIDGAFRERTTVSSDGEFALASLADGLYLASTDDGTWTKLPDIGFDRPGHRILLATDDYVIVEASIGDQLAKIPIGR